MKRITLLFFLFIAFAGCDEGIAPRPETVSPEFSGTVTFLGEWPSGVQRTHLVMFKNPLLTSDDFSITNIRYIGNEIPFGISEYNYISTDNFLEGDFEPGDYSYLAVAQSLTPVLSLNREDWNVVGVYTDNENQTPISLSLEENRIRENINITCDFNNPPPQPPGGN